MRFCGAVGHLALMARPLSHCPVFRRASRAILAACKAAHVDHFLTFQRSDNVSYGILWKVGLSGCGLLVVFIAVILSSIDSRIRGWFVILFQWLGGLIPTYLAICPTFLAVFITFLAIRPTNLVFGVVRVWLSLLFGWGCLYVSLFFSGLLWSNLHFWRLL